MLVYGIPGNIYHDGVPAHRNIHKIGQMPIALHSSICVWVDGMHDEGEIGLMTGDTPLGTYSLTKLPFGHLTSFSPFHRPLRRP